MSTTVKLLCMVIAVLLVSSASLVLLIQDKRKWDSSGEEEKKIPAISGKLRAYMMIAVIINIGMIFSIHKFYPDNTWLFTFKRVGLLSVIWPIAYIDYKTYRIPNSFILAGLILRAVILLAELIFREKMLLSTVLGEAGVALVVFVICMICRLIVKNGIGWGDIKLMFVMSLYLGIRGVSSALFVSLFLSFLGALFVLITKKKGKKDVLPFGPFIVTGTYLSVFLTGM